MAGMVAMMHRLFGLSKEVLLLYPDESSTTYSLKFGKNGKLPKEFTIKSMYGIDFVYEHDGDASAGLPIYRPKDWPQVNA